MLAQKLNNDLLNKVQNVQVSDTTGDAMKYKSRLPKNTSTIKSITFLSAEVAAGN